MFQLSGNITIFVENLDTMNKFQSFKQLLVADRSIRRFDRSKGIERSVLEELVGLTRYCASGRNAQPLKYRPVTDPAEAAAIFPALKWAGYYTEWDGPAEDERPVAYLIQCLDTEIAQGLLCDDGLQLQAITLGATALGIGACIIKAFDAPAVAAALDIPARFAPRYVLALGYPGEKVRITDMTPDGDFRYFRDSSDVQTVPKRPLSELIIS